MTWGEFVERFQAWLQHRHYAAKGVENYGRWLSRLADYADSHGLRPADLVAGYADAWAAQLEAMGVGEESRMQGLGCARRAYRWAVQEGLVAENPFAHWVLPRVRRPERACLTPEEVEQLLAQPKQTTRVGFRDYTLMSFLYGVGVRVSECMWTDMADVDLDNAMVAVRKAKRGKARLLPLAPRMQTELEAWLRTGRPPLHRVPKEPALFLSRDGGRLAVVSMEKMVREHAAAAGLSGVTPHRLRHAFASHLLAGGADVRAVQLLLGHESLQATQLYTHITPEDLREHLGRTHPRFDGPDATDGQDDG